LVGADSHLSGNVYATNPTTGVFGPVCDDSWDYKDVCTLYYEKEYIFFGML